MGEGRKDKERQEKGKEREENRGREWEVVAEGRKEDKEGKQGGRGSELVRDFRFLKGGSRVKKHEERKERKGIQETKRVTGEQRRKVREQFKRLME